MKKLHFYTLILSLIVIDLASKQFANHFLREHVPLIGGFLQLSYVENTGIAFSIELPFLKVLTIILILGIFYYYTKEEAPKKSPLIDTAFALILAGAIGNGLERVFQNYVIDFIAVSGFSVFNLADSFITVGAFLYLLHLFLKK